MRITEAFQGEHGVLFPQIDHLRASLSTRANREVLQARAALLASGLDEHAQLEEDLLFVPMEDHVDQGDGPLAVMRAEHEEIKRSLEVAQSSESVEEVVRFLRHVADVARDHFLKEERILFPMADDILAEPDLLALGERWAAARLGVVDAAGPG